MPSRRSGRPISRSTWRGISSDRRTRPHHQRQRPDRRRPARLRALAFAIGPELGEIDTLNGSVQFLQVVGLTSEEYQAAQGGNAPALLQRLSPSIPLYSTDIDRGPLVPPR
ncbi:suppressor of fused domain protein [Nocardia vinacea]|nr:suppressor of fused domain protein [Nocardia vinacea]